MTATGYVYTDYAGDSFRLFRSTIEGRGYVGLATRNAETIAILAEDVPDVALELLKAAGHKTDSTIATDLAVTDRDVRHLDDTITTAVNYLTRAVVVREHIAASRVPDSVVDAIRGYSRDEVRDILQSAIDGGHVTLTNGNEK